MELRTPITLITGPLGSGKTTLLRHILATRPAKNRGRDERIRRDRDRLEGRRAEKRADRRTRGGCVCCSLLGEFEAAVNEIIQRVEPDIIVVETTGLAEPEALVFNIQEALPQCRLDGVASVIDADMLVRFPELGHTTRLQIEGADIFAFEQNRSRQAPKTFGARSAAARNQSTAAIVRTKRCQIDPAILFGVGREEKVAPPEHKHQPEFESFTFSSEKTFSRDCFERFADGLPASMHRAKGFMLFPDGAQLFNFVAGRWDLEPFETDRTDLVFIGKKSLRKNQSSSAHSMSARIQTTNDEARSRRTKEAGSQNNERIHSLASSFDIRHSDFVIYSAFVIRH